MTEEDRKRILEEIIYNSDAVSIILYYMNEKIDSHEIKLPGNHNIYSYFMTGHCNLYSLILCKIFGEYATPYANSGHIVTKIGNDYYDATGFVTYEIKSNANISEKRYYEYTIDKLTDIKSAGLGLYDPTEDDEIIKQLVEVGKFLLDSKINYKYEMEHALEQKENRTHKL